MLPRVGHRTGAPYILAKRVCPAQAYRTVQRYREGKGAAWCRTKLGVATQSQTETQYSPEEWGRGRLEAERGVGERQYRKQVQRRCHVEQWIQFKGCGSRNPIKCTQSDSNQMQYTDVQVGTRQWYYPQKSSQFPKCNKWFQAMRCAAVRALKAMLTLSIQLETWGSLGHNTYSKKPHCRA
jgi:hypothetical protein